MSSTIKIENFGSLNIKESTKLDADSLAAASTLILAYTDNIATNDILYLGVFSSEQSERVNVNTVGDAKNVTLISPTRKPHSRFDPAVTLFGDKINIYHAPNVDGTQPADDQFSPLIEIDIDFDDNSSIYTDAAGSSDWWYKFTYLNSTTTAETDLADSPAVRGGGVGDYASIDSIRKRAGLQNNRFITDGAINEKRQAAQDEINANLVGLYAVPFTPPVNNLIAEVTRRLAAGMTLLDDYGPTAVLDTTNGQKMLDDARALLARIKDKELILTDVLGAGTSIEGANTLTMYPDDTTAISGTDGNAEPHPFRMSDRY